MCTCQGAFASTSGFAFPSKEPSSLPLSEPLSPTFGAPSAPSAGASIPIWAEALLRELGQAAESLSKTLGDVRGALQAEPFLHDGLHVLPLRLGGVRLGALPRRRSFGAVLISGLLVGVAALGDGAAPAKPAPSRPQRKERHTPTPPRTASLVQPEAQ